MYKNMIVIFFTIAFIYTIYAFILHFIDKPLQANEYQFLALYLPAIIDIIAVSLRKNLGWFLIASATQIINIIFMVLIILVFLSTTSFINFDIREFIPMLK